MAESLEKPDNGKYQKLVEHCLDLYKEFKKSTYRAEKIKEIEESRKAYEQKADKKDFPWPDAANTVMPLTTIAVDNLEPRLVSGLIGTDPIVKFDADGPANPIIEALESWFNGELKNVVNVKNYAIQTVHNILIEGTFYSTPKYVTEKKKINDFVFDGRGIIKINPETEGADIQEIETTVFEGGKFDSIPFTDIFCADDLGTPEDWENEPVIRIVRPTYAELAKKKGKLGYMNIGRWLIGEKGDTNMGDDQASPGQKMEGIEVTGKETIESIECHLSYYLPLDSEKDEDERSTFIEEKIIVTISLQSEVIYRLVRQQDINFSNDKVIKRTRGNPEPGRSFGTGLYGKIKSIQNCSSDLFNHMLNIAILVMIPFFFYDNKSGLKDQVTVKPGQGVPVDDVNGIKVHTFNVNPEAFMGFLNFFVTLWERVTSIADPQIGRLADRKETATAILTAVQEGGVKHNYQAEIFKEEFLSALYTMYDLYYQNMPYEKPMIKVNGHEVLARKEMKRQFKFRLTGSTEKANKLIARKEAEDLYTMFGGDQLSNQVKLRTDLFKEYGKEKPEEYIDPGVNQILLAMQAIPQLKEQLTVIANQAMAGAKSGESRVSI